MDTSAHQQNERGERKTLGGVCRVVLCQEGTSLMRWSVFEVRNR
jgi:hypothetical protein